MKKTILTTLLSRLPINSSLSVNHHIKSGCGWGVENVNMAGVKRKKPSVPLDTSQCNRGVWLVKVPNYLSEAWNESKTGEVVGTMKIRT